MKIRFAAFTVSVVVLAIAAFCCFEPEELADNDVFVLSQADAKSPENRDYDLSSIVILTRVISYIRNYYYDSSRIDPEAMFIEALDSVARKIPSVMVDFNREAKLVHVKIDSEQKVFEYGELDSIWKIQYRIAEIFRFIQPKLEEGIDPKEVEYAAINGMLDILDPHSILLSPRVYRELKLSTVGNFGGLGIQIGVREGSLTIIAPIQDTPAWRAGLKAKDVIEKIDGQSTINMSLEEAVQLMRGERGTPCTLTISRKSLSEPKDFKIIRDIIKIRSVNAELLPGMIAYVQVKNFQGNTVSDLKNELKQMKRKGSIKGLILDLRGNPGGLLEAATKAADLFLETGVIVTTVGARNEPLEISEATFLGTEEKYPTAVLVGSSSASASEIVAGALKNNNRAVVIGDRTFGKGSVQILYDMEDKSALKLTVAQYLTPGKVSIQSVGIVPDIELWPVYIEEDLIDFYASEKMGREQDLDHHLRHKSTVEDKPFEHLRYLYDKERDEIDIDAPPDTINAKDFTVQFAAEMLRGIGNISRREIILQRSVKLLRKTQQTEEEKIVKRFKKMGLDWTVHKQSVGSKAEIDIKTDIAEPLPGGKDVNIEVTVKNTGDRPFTRLRSITDSDNPVFDGMEFFFGVVEPGKSKTWKSKTSIPKSAYSRSDDVVFRFHQREGDPAPADVTRRFDIVELPSSAFSYTYQIDDAAGNGDGLLQKGETVKLLLDIDNVGQAEVEEGLAILKNADNLKEVFINAGRVEFKKLKPGESLHTHFSFQVKSDLQVDSFPMEITIMDTERRDYVSDDVEFRISDPLALIPSDKGKSVYAASGLPIFGSPDTGLPRVATLENDGPLLVKGKSGSWYKIAMAEDRSGWVKLEQAESGKNKGKIVKPAISTCMQVPRIEISRMDGLFYTEQNQIEIEGWASDNNRIKDLYILNESRKVFYKSNGSRTDSKRIEFSTLIDLEEGSNRITIIARESEDFIGRRNFAIYRKKSPSKEIQAATP